MGTPWFDAGTPPQVCFPVILRVQDRGKYGWPIREVDGLWMDADGAFPAYYFSMEHGVIRAPLAVLSWTPKEIAAPKLNVLVGIVHIGLDHGAPTVYDLATVARQEPDAHGNRPR